MFTGRADKSFDVTTFIKEKEKEEFSVLSSGIPTIHTLDYCYSNEQEVFCPNTPSISRGRITGIGEGTFQRKLLESIHFPENSHIFRIGEDAFRDCKNLKKIRLPNLSYRNVRSYRTKDGIFLRNTVFSGCTSLRECILPQDLQNVGDEVFVGCIKLSHIAQPHFMKTMGTGVFSGCIALNTCEYYFSLETVPVKSFENCIKLNEMYIPSSVRSIQSEAFLNCKGLNEIYIHSSVKTMEPKAFSACDNLMSVQGLNPNLFEMEALKMDFGDTPGFKKLNQ